MLIDDVVALGLKNDQPDTVRLAHRLYWRRLKLQPELRGKCAVCELSPGGHGDCRIEGHHFDYSLPYSVIWLCHVHHRQVHKRLKAGYV